MELTKQTLYRSVNLDRNAINEEQGTVELSFSSEAAIVERGWGGEILDHSPDAVKMDRLTDGAPLLLGHDPDKQIGVVEEARIDPDKVGRAIVRFSKSVLGQEIFQDVKDGIRKKVSVGYQITGAEEDTRSTKDNKLYRVKWAPMEISIVSIPADNKVGVGRAAEETNIDNTVEVPEVPEVVIETREVAKPEAELIIPEPQVVSDTVTETVEVRQEEQSEAVQAVLITIKENKMEQTQPLNMEVLTEKEQREYSIHKLIASSLPNSKVDAGFEREVGQDLAKQMGRNADGIIVPMQVLFSKRDQTVASNDLGGYLKGTDHRGDMFIDVLTAQLVSGRLGATILPGLVGDVTIPRQSGTSTAAWVAEGNAATESSASYGYLTLQPKTLTANVDITRKLLLQASPSIEQIIRNDIGRQIALGIDTAVFHGAGTNEPVGIVNTSGMTSGSGATFGITSASVMEGKILNANYLSDNMAWVTTPSLYATLKGRVKVSSYPSYIVEGGAMHGYPMAFSNVVSSGYMFLGDFSQIFIGQWGPGVELMIDPYTGSTTGNVKVVGFASVDVGLRQAAAFTYLSSVS